MPPPPRCSPVTIRIRPEKMLVIPFFIEHRGCSHRCLFCDQWAITGEPGRDETTGDLPARLQRTVATWLGYGSKRRPIHVAFFGGSFTCLDAAVQRLLLETLQPYLHAGTIDSIRLSTRPDCLSDESARFLRAFGVRTVEIGAQSMADTVLQRVKRGHTVADTEAAIGVLARAGLTIGVQLMVGLPGETTASFFRGVQRVIALRPHFVRLYPALALSGTGLAESFQDGSWRPLGLDRAVALTGRARELFAEQGITVVRMGLQPSAHLAERVIAGPYHPAFGELVYNREWYLRMRKLLVCAGPGRTVTLSIAPRDYSAVVGNKRRNLYRLQGLPAAAGLTVVTDSTLARGCFHYVIH